MSLFARLSPDAGIAEVREFAAPPDRKGWLPLIVDPQPTPGANQVVADAGIVFGQTEARQTWALRARTQAELDAADDAADRQALQADAIILKAEIGGAIGDA